MADQALIKKIMDEVTDPALRDKLLASLIANEPLNDMQRNVLTGLGLKPDAIAKTVKFNQTMNKVGMGLFFLLGVGLTVNAVISQDFFASTGIIGVLFMIATPLMYLVNRKYYDNMIAK